jgi:hypothetical protein
MSLRMSGAINAGDASPQRFYCRARYANRRACPCSSAVEQRFCKPKVGGSIPSGGTRRSLWRPRFFTFLSHDRENRIRLMSGSRNIGTILVACGALLTLAGCSRTSDGSIVAVSHIPVPDMTIPSVDPVVPSWMRRKPRPEQVAVNFPAPPQTEQPRPRRRKAQPPVVSSNSGNLSCENKTEGGRVRMVCQ